MIKDYPIIINDTEMPWADTPYTETRETIEEVNISEAGTDIIQIQRKGKLTLSFNYQLPTSYKELFYSFYSDEDTLTVQVHNGTSYVSHIMRMRNWTCQLVPGAEQTDGVYKFSFDLIEM